MRFSAESCGAGAPPFRTGSRDSAVRGLSVFGLWGPRKAEFRKVRGNNGRAEFFYAVCWVRAPKNPYICK